VQKRAYGSGSIFVRGGSYFGKWRQGGRQVKRKLGPVRRPGTREGLTKARAEARLRTLMSGATVTPVEQRVTLAEAGRRYLHNLATVEERKPATIQDYRIILDRHLVPALGSKALDRVTRDDVSAFIADQLRRDAARQSIVNRVNLLPGSTRSPSSAAGRARIRSPGSAAPDRAAPRRTSGSLRSRS
jgi:integrase